MSIKANKDNAVFISNTYLQEDGYKASATVTFGVNPIDGHNIVLNGTTFTYRTTPAVANDVAIGATIEDSIDNLLTEALPATATYTKVGTNQIFIEYSTIGTVGNNYTIVSNFTAVPSSLSGGSDTPDGDWVDNTPTVDYHLPELVLEGAETTSTALVSYNTLAENDKVKVYNSIEGLVEGNLGTITLEQGTMFVPGLESGTSGTFIAPTDGLISVAMAGGGGGGGGGGDNSNSSSGGGGSGLKIVENIAVTAGQIIPFTIGAGGAGKPSGTGSGANGKPTTILGHTALGGNGGSSTTGGIGSNGGGTGGSGTNAYGTPGNGFQFPTLNISIAGVAGSYGISGSYGGGGSGGGQYGEGKPGSFGGGGGGSRYDSGGRGGDGYIYIAFAPNKYIADISSLGLFNPPTKAWLDKPINVATVTENDENRCIAKDEILDFVGSTLTTYEGASTKSGLITTGDSIQLNGTTDVVCSEVVEDDLTASVVGDESYPVPIGSFYEGGYYAGKIRRADGIYALIVSPRALGQRNLAWKNIETTSGGSKSLNDGAANTAYLVSAENATVYPAAHFCNNLVINGFSDWYLPARDELEIAYRNLKPTTEANVSNGYVGVNGNSVPEGAAYTASNPAQTSIALFQQSRAESFYVDENSRYFSSTEDVSSTSWVKSFSGTYSGSQNGLSKANPYYVRAFRSVKLYTHKYTCTFDAQESAPTSAKVLDRSITAAEVSDIYDNVNNKFIKTYDKIEQEGRAFKYKIEADKGVQVDKVNIQMNRQP